MPILEQAKPICFYETVGVCVPEVLDIWASFGDPLLIVSILPGLTKTGANRWEALKNDRSKLADVERAKIIEQCSSEDSKSICTVQELPKGISFFEFQMFTKAQVSAMIDNKKRMYTMEFDQSKKKKGNFSHCLLWWRD